MKCQWRGRRFWRAAARAFCLPAMRQASTIQSKVPPTMTQDERGGRKEVRTSEAGVGWATVQHERERGRRGDGGGGEPRSPRSQKTRPAPEIQVP